MRCGSVAFPLFNLGENKIKMNRKLILAGAVALAVGGIAGVLFVWMFTRVQNVWRIDDVLGVWPLHGLCGACGGIACGLAEEGAKLVCIDYRLDFAEACAKEIRDGGGEAIAVACDVTKDDQVHAAVKRAEDAFGAPDILVNGAMLQIRKGVLDMNADEFRRLLDVGVIGTFLFTQHAAKSMIRHQRRGSIINIISTEGHQGNLGNIGYGTAKSGLLNFTRAAAMELAEHGIRVNSVAPGAVITQSRAGLPEDPNHAQVRMARIPMKKLCTIEEVASAVAYMASPQASYITGQTLVLDGGVTSQ